MRLNVGRLLLNEGLVTADQLPAALAHQALHGGAPGQAFVSLGFVQGHDMVNLLSVYCGVPPLFLDDFRVDPAVARIIPAEVARRHRVLPLARFGATLAIAVADPTNTAALGDVHFLAGYDLEAFVTAESDLADAIERCFGECASTEPRADIVNGPRRERAEGPPAAEGDSEWVEIDLGALCDAAREVRGDESAARVSSERTAWAYVTAMHAAAMGGPRAPIRGIVGSRSRPTTRSS
jgi:hypothetical protein